VVLVPFPADPARFPRTAVVRSGPT
jgi:hypothetical protein